MRGRITISCKDETLSKHRGVKAWLRYLNEEVNRELTPDKLAMMALGCPHKIEIVDGKLCVTVFEDFLLSSPPPHLTPESTWKNTDTKE